MIQKLIQTISVFFSLLVISVGFLHSSYQPLSIHKTLIVYAEDASSTTSSSSSSTASSTTTNKTSNTATRVSNQKGGYLGRNFGCVIPATSLSLTNLFVPAVFLPVIPENCSKFEGEPIPLSPVLIPSIIVRLFGLIASLIFYLLFFNIIVSGIMWTWGGIDNKNITQAKQNFKDTFVAIGLLLGTFIIISTILGILTPNEIETDMNKLFYINTTK